MEIKIKHNAPVDLTFFKENLRTLEEVKLVNPSATFPINERYWMNFFNDGYKTESLIFKKNGVDIGHVALKQSKQEEPVVFLCFLLISNVERGKGLSKSIIKLTEQYLQSEYGVNEYYLNVLLENEIAINLYKSVGFNEVSRTQARIRMKKILE